MTFLTTLAGFAAPAFLILSPVFSYSDQAYSMHRSRSSAGFSLDIPLIMLVASIFRIFYYPGAKFDTALLVQSLFMIVVQSVLLKIALDHRPSSAANPFLGAHDGAWEARRPYNFWQWKSPKPYWQFLLWLFIGLTALELLLAPFRGIYSVYSPLLGYIGLSVEATLPLPQMYANAKSRSCKGFRPSVLVSWLLGDAMKMFWFFTSVTEIPWAFKLCGIFQAACDLFLGLQYVMYGSGDSGTAPVRSKDHEMSWPIAHRVADASGRDSPIDRRAEKQAW